LTWQSYYSGQNPFYSQTLYKSGLSGNSAARSGATNNNGYTCIYTAVQAPGTLSFIWSPSSELGKDFLNFYSDDSLVKSLSGSGADVGKWLQESYKVSGNGSISIEFCYEKNATSKAYLDSGFLDKVAYVRSNRVATSSDQTGPVRLSELSSQAVNRQGLKISASTDGMLIQGADPKAPRLRSPRSRASR
jgi:hypothetical protein